MIEKAIRMLTVLTSVIYSLRSINLAVVIFGGLVSSYVQNTFGKFNLS